MKKDVMIVTGAGRGLGKAFAKEAVRNGAFEEGGDGE